MIEIRWHGRGGQGAVTAARLLAGAAMRQGKYFHAFPEFGPERRGAPVQAFTRISDEPIRTYANVKNPAAVVVLDSTLIGRVPITEGLGDDGVVVANFVGSAADLRRRLGLTDSTIKVFAVDATAIALRRLGRPITNTPMLGALAKATAVLQLDSLMGELRDSLGGKFRPEVLEANLGAMEDAFQEVTGE